jgi:hypothetical protein
MCSKICFFSSVRLFDVADESSIVPSSMKFGTTRKNIKIVDISKEY